jgi:hypothetical protein
VALAYRPRDAPLQFFKISGRYHRTSRIVAEVSLNPNGADTVGTKFVSIFDRRHDVITSTRLRVRVTVRAMCGS